MPGLKKILKWTMQQTEENPEGAGASSPLTDEKKAWLSEAMDAMCLNETQRLKDLVEIIEASPNTAKLDSDNIEHDTNTLSGLLTSLTASELLKLQKASLEELTERLEQIDNARFFALNHGGNGKLPLIMNIMSNGNDNELRWRAADVFAAVTQNNPEVQTRAMDLGALTLVMNIIIEEKIAEKVKLKAFLALSCLIRGTSNVSLKHFVEEGGIALIRRILSDVSNNKGAAKLQRKSLFLLQYICVSAPEYCTNVADDDALLSRLVNFCGSKDATISDMGLQVLTSLSSYYNVAKFLAGEDSSAKQILESLQTRFNATPDEEKEWVEEPLKLCKKLLVVANSGVPLNESVPQAIDSSSLKEEPMKAITDKTAIPELNGAMNSAVRGLLDGKGTDGKYTVSIPTSASSTIGMSYGPQLQAWCSQKVSQWEAEVADASIKAKSASLHRKGLDTREKLDSWMNQQCSKALEKKKQQRLVAASKSVETKQVNSGVKFHGGK